MRVRMRITTLVPVTRSNCVMAARLGSATVRAINKRNIPQRAPLMLVSTLCDRIYKITMISGIKSQCRDTTGWHFLVK